jgi:hypothetical protein
LSIAVRCAEVIWPKPHEQLNCLMSVLADMACSTSLGLPLIGSASKTTTFARPGAMEIAISISSATSAFPLSGPLVGMPSKPSSSTFSNGTFGNPIWLSYDVMSLA